MSVPATKLGLRKPASSFPSPTDRNPPAASLDTCPHCGRPVIVKATPRCSFCGEALQEGVLSWSDVEREAAARQARDLAVPEIVPPDIGLDAAGRARAYAQLRNFFHRSPDRLEQIDLFVRGLTNDFPTEQALASRTCGCGQPGEVVVSVNWHGRVDAGTRFDGFSAVMLLFGLPSKGRKWSEFQTATHHAACSACARPKGWFDRYERFFGKIPGFLRVVKVERQPFPPGAASAATRGSDLCCALAVTAGEEANGFTRTLRLQRQTEPNEAAHRGALVAEATEEIAMPPGWAEGQRRRTDSDCHYALRLRGRGNRGVPVGNDGDLFVTVTVQD